ncbi:MAG TPA: hypothetical protein VG897_13180, partial [Terriglobales bacterium]|nr:hypothetical protein [Terriglobales bacterium]
AGTFFVPTGGETAKANDIAKQIFTSLQQGKVDRSLLTSNCNAYFDETGLHDYASSLGPLGNVQDFTLTSESLRGGMVHRSYGVKLDSRSVSINSYWMPDGKLEQFIVTPRD